MTDKKRDADTLNVLGFFFLVLGGLVLVATFWTLGNSRAMVVNLGSGLAMATVGVVMRYAARRLVDSV